MTEEFLPRRNTDEEAFPALKTVGTLEKKPYLPTVSLDTPQTKSIETQTQVTEPVVLIEVTERPYFRHK